jgi:saccharopine dehydrogenase-like NADP-dependent oxidoreductase
MNRPRIVVYGGSGFFGRLLVKDLLEHSDADIMIASRNPGPVDFHPYESRVRFILSDINDYESVVTTVQGAKAAICCSGPFQRLTLNLLRACIEKEVHYIDVADDRDYVVRCHDLSERIKQAGIMAFVGCSLVPGISSLLTKLCAEEVGTVETTRIFITPGTRHTRGPGSFLCLLSTLGKQYSIPAGGKEKLVHGWTEREKVEFPPPIGKRSVYSVVDIADYFLQPVHFGTRSVEFKIGSELEFLNLLLTVLRLVMGYISMKTPKWFLPLSRMIVYAASWFGTTQGAVMVEVSGGFESGARQMSLSVYTEENGEVIPSVLASIAVQKILTAEVGHQGIVPLHRWLSKGEFVDELSKRDIKVVSKGPNSDKWEHF